MLVRVAQILLALMICLGAAVPVSAAEAPQPPTQPAPGKLGGEGPCGQTAKSAPSVARPTRWVWVFEPTGDAAPRTGGRCGDVNRPVVFIAHGWGQVLPGLGAEGVIGNLVSNGNIVVFANYGPAGSMLSDRIAYQDVWSGYQQATRMTERMNLADIGIWGYSHGTVMSPWLAQQAAARGWGAHSMWLQLHAPGSDAGLVGTGPIALPPGTRVNMVAYDRDQVLDPRAGVEMFGRLNVEPGHKRYVQIISDCAGDECSFTADHFTPTASNYMSYYGTYRNWQALSDCVRVNAHCDTDLSYMGTWSDGHPAVPATVTEG